MRVFASKRERLALFRKLALSGRLRPIRPVLSRLPYAGGLFSVIKDLHRDRLIFDCRPANSLEKPASKWTSSLAGPECLLQLALRDDECLQTSSAHLRDYFYLFTVTPDRLRRNLAKGHLSRSEARWVFDHDCGHFADHRLPLSGWAIAAPASLLRLLMLLCSATLAFCEAVRCSFPGIPCLEGSSGWASLSTTLLFSVKDVCETAVKAGATQATHLEFAGLTVCTRPTSVPSLKPTPRRA